MKADAIGKAGWKERVQGHWLTVGSTVRHGLRSALLADELWTMKIPNEFGDPIYHSGRFLSGGAGEETLVVILHGLGGDVERGYCREAALAAQQEGFSSLRLALRGADQMGEDFYHAGFTESLGALLRAPRWEKVERIALMGFSLGGSIALRAAAEGIDPRIRAAVAICPPLDLSAAQRHIDSPRASVYRRVVLEALKKSYERVSRAPKRAGLALPPPERVEATRRVAVEHAVELTCLRPRTHG